MTSFDEHGAAEWYTGCVRTGMGEKKPGMQPGFSFA
jgi:hypothetical protein